MATLFGRNAIVYLQGSGAQADLLSEAADFQISLDFESGDDGAFGDLWVTNLKGRMKWSGSIAGNLDTSSNVMFDSATQMTSRKFYAYPDRANMGAYYYGTCFPKLSTGASLSAVAKFSGTLDGDGQMARQ